MTPGQFKSKYVGTDVDKSMHFNSQPCPFLGTDNRCTVYESRPTACHDYPYLYKSEFRSRSFMMIDSTATCPIVFNVWQRLKKRLGFRGRR